MESKRLDKVETIRLSDKSEDERNLVDTSEDDRCFVTFDEKCPTDDEYRIRRTIKVLERYGFAKLIAYYLVIASEVLEDEPYNVSLP